MKCICDTCVLIDFLRGDEATREKLLLNAKDGTAMSAVTYMELMVGALNKREAAMIKRTFAHFNIIEINERVSLIARLLVEQFAKSHGLLIPDALIAAAALETGLPLWTTNLSDFRYIPGIVLL